MSFWKSFLPAAGILCLEICCFSVAHAAGNTNTPITLPQIAQAFSQGQPVHSVVLSASAQWTAGSDSESGNATLTASADGSFSVQLQLPKSSRTESQTSFAAGQSCTWSGNDGVVHVTPLHNCLSSVAWFLPSISLLGGQQPSQITTTIGTASATGLLDIQQQRQPAANSSSFYSALLTQLGTTHLYLDANTYLPTGLFFNMHPDDNSGADIPMHVVFSDYQQVNGVMIPFRIQRYLNGTLNLDLTVTQASVN